MNILIDGVLFQYAEPADANAQSCRAILQELVSEAAQSESTISILDRGRVPHIDGMRVIAFPSFRNETPAADAVLVQRLCSWLAIDVFISTGLTAPISTATMQLMVGSDLDLVQCGRKSASLMRDCDIALAFSTFLICSTTAMETACRLRFPDLSNDRIPDSTEFRPLVGDMRDDCVRTMSRQIVALGQQAIRRSSSRKIDFLRKWSKVREIQAAIEIS